MRLEEWQFSYNWHRPHSSLGGKTPMERCCELSEHTALNEEAFANYDTDKELKSAASDTHIIGPQSVRPSAIWSKLLLVVEGRTIHIV
jgi:hypothetical protein